MTEAQIRSQCGKRATRGGDADIPFELRQSANSQRPRVSEPRMQPSSPTAFRSHTATPAPNRRCVFSMTDQNKRSIGTQ